MARALSHCLRPADPKKLIVHLGWHGPIIVTFTHCPFVINAPLQLYWKLPHFLIWTAETKKENGR
jgi:hypothetical protein